MISTADLEHCRRRPSPHYCRGACYVQQSDSEHSWLTTAPTPHHSAPGPRYLQQQRPHCCSISTSSCSSISSVVVSALVVVVVVVSAAVVAVHHSAPDPHYLQQQRPHCCSISTSSCSSISSSCSSTPQRSWSTLPATTTITLL